MLPYLSKRELDEILHHTAIVDRDFKSTSAQNSLIEFACQTHKSYKVNWHHKRLASKLEDVANGKLKRLLISMPPRHGKTELASIRFGPWYLGQHPTHNIIQTTYSAEYAEENAKKSRYIVLSPEYRDIFGFSVDRDSRAVSRWKTEKGGSYYAVGVGGPLTGRGANLLIVDDPHKNRQEAESPVIRKNVWDWFTSTAYTRLEDNGAIIVIMTRWHEADLIGCILSGSEEWEYICLPAIAEQDEQCRKEGEPLWPQKYDLAALQNIKTAIGSKQWESLYQQRPSAAEGEIFKREYWQYYQLRFMPLFKKIIHSWDTAFKKGSQNDYSVCTVWGVTDTGYYLIYRWKERVEFPELKRTVISIAAQIPPNEILIEDKASGQSLIQELQRETRLPIAAYKIDGDKVARANAVTPIIESGKVYLPADAEWLQDYIDTLAAFPNAVHDDDVDSTTQALSAMQNFNGIAFSSF